MKNYIVDLYDYFKVQKPEGAKATLTVYLRQLSKEINENRKHPAMLVIPGGGYGMVSEREGEPVALRYFALGFNSFVLDYSVAPIKFPYQLLEAVMAITYIRKNADELGVNPNMVSAVGFSAGGHLCGMLGSYWDSEEVNELFGSDINARPDAVILSYPVITCKGKTHGGSFENLCGAENIKLQEKLDITNLVNENSSPAFIWSTYNDGVVPVRNALLAALAYEEKGVPFSVHVWGKAQHGISVADRTVYGGVYDGFKPLEDMSESVATWIDLSVEWLKERGFQIKE